MIFKIVMGILIITLIVGLIDPKKAGTVKENRQQERSY